MKQIRKKKAIILVTLLLIACLYLFNFKSNLHFAFDSGGNLYNYDVSNQELVYESQEVIVRKINIRRKYDSNLKRVINKLSRPTLYYFEFKNNQSNFSVSYHPEGGIADDNISPETIFSINSAFYNEAFEPNGLVTINGEEFGRISNSSGHFKVIDGVASAGPTSLFAKSKNPEYSCQSHPSLMKNGTIWDYILKESKNSNYWASRTYRSLVGQKYNGNVCFIVSGNGGLVSVREIALVAKQNGITTATCLDAGSALQYKFRDVEFSLSFSSLNNSLSFGKRVDKLTSQVVGKRFYSESPAFINYRSSSLTETKY